MAADLHGRLISGEIRVEATPEVLVMLAEKGMTLEDLKKQLIAATRKSLS